jgi:predicted DNA binding CopG/RHH family protein
MSFESPNIERAQRSGVSQSLLTITQRSGQRMSKKHKNLRLPQHLLDSIKVAANARDVPYQSLIKVWLQEKVGNR